MKNIVLTGGPCGGKSTAIGELQECLEQRGYKVFILDESATRLINKGIKPFGENAIDMYDFQKIIMKYQLYREHLIRSKAKLFKNSIVLYDRSTIDNKSYLDEVSWHKLLRELNLNEQELMNRYDEVIHLVTVADGKEELYTTENNHARSEDADLAKKKDIDTLNAYIGHNNLKVVDNSTDFATKINRVKNCILEELGEPIIPNVQHKFLVDLDNSNIDKVKAISNKSYITQTYLKTDEYLEKRIRQRIVNGKSTYYLTTKQLLPNNEIVKTNKKINKLYYLYLLKEKDLNLEPIEKIRYSFRDNKEVYNLDVFKDNNYAILENETTKDINSLQLPTYLNIIEKIHDFSNLDIAKNKKLIKKI
ncbi:MAG: AAA family ATPase [Bacilli bacterium]